MAGLAGLLGLITLCALGAFTLLYVSASIPKKPPAVEKAIELIKKYMYYLGIGCVAYGVFAAFVTPLTIYTAANMIMRLLANLLLVIMAAPYAFSRFEGKIAAKMNVAIFDELKALITWPLRHEKYLGFAGAGMCVLVFVFAFSGM